MKVLLIGMDGAHLDVFNRGWTPFTSSLIKKGTQLNIKNDLISRGWLEIATGQHASKTGAMYDKPKADGTLHWNPKFSINDIPGINTSIKPLWQALNEKGHRVGIMNLPTVFPAPTVDGFFVSGGGGGAPVVAKPTEDLCYPKDILKLLHKNNYIVDERFAQLVIDKNLTKPSQIFSRFTLKNQKRTQSFIELANKYKIDFGFVIYKTSSVIAETVLIPEWVKDKKDKSLISALESYYNHFDEEIKKLHTAFPSTRIVFVSDHGSVSRKFSVNPNILLQESGLQTVSTNKNIYKKTIQKLKSFIPFSIKMALKKSSVINNAVAETTNFDSPKTLAFCRTTGDWSHGIYINDKTRFGGPVEKADINKIKNTIINKFNAHPDVKKHKLNAYSKPDDALEHFPDIMIDLPNGYLTIDTTKSFIEKYIPQANISRISSIMKGDIDCMKSHTPLAVYCGNNGEIEPDQTENDLTAIYDLILKNLS